MKIVTHSGNFHADDVFAVATLLLIYPEAEVVRSRNQDEIQSADIVVDVGGLYDISKNRFDHHQTGGAGVRENGIPYASFGLVWREFGEKIAGSLGAKAIEEKLVYFIDALDNGVTTHTPIFEGVKVYDISDYFYSYWIDEDVDTLETLRVFKRVVALAKDLIEREVYKAKRILEDEAKVESLYESAEDRRVIVMDKHYASGKILSGKPEPLFTIYPNLEGSGWCAKAVRKDQTSFDIRIKFPEAWAGKNGEELAKASGVADAVFCHNKLFLAVAKSKEGALALAHKALNQ